jgi:hypothetical protein
MADVLIVCQADPDLCWGCGEWLHVKQRGGYLGPDGNRFCADDCIGSYLDHLAWLDRRSEIYKCCDECGFDRLEHQVSCSRAADWRA